MKSTMAMENRIEILKADVQQKVGRNIILFQQVEAMLNFLAAYGEFSREPMKKPSSRIFASGC